MAELIQKQDTLNEGRVKINAAITNAEQAKVTADGADSKATQALANSESTQTQLDTIVINGDSSVEAAQARVDEKGVGHTTLKDRIDDGMNSVNQQLAETVNDLNVIGNSIENYSHLVPNKTDDESEWDWSIPIQTMIDAGLKVLIPEGEYKFSQTLKFDNNFYMRGKTTESSKLTYTGSGNGIESKHKGVRGVNFPVIERLTLGGSGGDIGIDLTHVDHGEISFNEIHGFDYAVRLQQDDINGIDRCFYNEIYRNRIRATKACIHITGNKPNANSVEYNRFSSAETGIFIEIKRSEGFGPVNTLKINNNNYFNLKYCIRAQFVESCEFQGNRFEGVDHGFYWDESHDARHRDLKIADNHYNTEESNWVGSPDINSCVIIEDMFGEKKNIFPKMSVLGPLEYTGRMTTNLIGKEIKRVSVAENETFTESFAMAYRGVGKVTLMYFSGREVGKLYLEGIFFNTGSETGFTETKTTLKQSTNTGEISITTSGNVLTLNKTSGTTSSGGSLVYIIEGMLE